MWKIERVVKKGDYLYAVVHGHPNATKNNYVLMHRIVMENHIGRPLNKNEVVHHIDGNKFNNDISNLALMKRSEHSKEHGNLRGHKAVKLKCPNCGKIFVRDFRNTFQNCKRVYGRFCSRSCSGVFAREAELHGLTHEMERAISENIVNVFRESKDARQLRGNQDQGSVETIRTSAEMPKK